MIKGYLIINEAGEKWRITPRWGKNMYTTSEIDGIVQFDRLGTILKDEEKPPDDQITS